MQGEDIVREVILTGIFILYYCYLKFLVAVSDIRAYDRQWYVCLLHNVLTNHKATKSLSQFIALENNMNALSHYVAL